MPKQTLQQFGQSIKAKHPEYKDMDDTALAKAVLAKYPQYADMVEAEAPTTPTNGRTPTGEPEAGDKRNAAQRWLDNLITPDPRREEWQSPTRNAIDDFARHVAENAVPLISHPVQSGIGMLKSIGGALAEGHGSPMMIGESLARPLIEHAVEDYQQHGPVRGTTNLIGSGLGAAATGELMGGAGNKLIQAAGPAVSDILKRTGLALGNNALGARGPKPFKYGANPARGAYEEGVLPAMGKHSAAMKTEAALPEVGQRISAGVESGNPVPLSDIAESIESPIRQGRNILEGPGGANRSSEPLNALLESMTHRAPGATQPVYGPSAGRPFSATEAAAAMTAPSRPLLPAPTEDIPLADMSKTRNPKMSPMAFPAEENRLIQGEGRNLHAEPEGKIIPRIDRYGLPDPQYLSGSAHPELSGRIARPGGVLRRPMTFGESTEPSPLLDLRHPEATAPDVWRTIQNIDANTRFNPDPEIEGLNEVRRSIRGGLRGNLEEAAPDIIQPSRTYSDLKGAQEALDRSMHGGLTFGKLLSVPTFPLESGAGALLYHASQMPAPPRLLLPAAAGTASLLTDRGNQ